jgi:glycosyltransferase involved in cell wall biosynthesis
MRVVWITHNYPRRAGDVAGGFLHPLAIALRRKGVDVRVIAPSHAGNGGQGELDGVPVNRVRYGSAGQEQLAYGGTTASALASPWRLMAFDRLRAALRAGAAEALGAATGPTLVHAHWWVPGGLAAPQLTPLVLTCHGTDVRLLDRSRIAAWMARPVFHRAKVVTTVSRPLAEVIRRRVGISVSEDAIQPMPVVKAERPWTDGSGSIVIIGRLTQQKRVHLALEAVALVRSELPLSLTIVGDGPGRDALERRAAQLGLAGTVRFMGEVPPDRVPSVLATATCCLMPAVGEGFGLAAAEALMQGVPVVACLDGGGLCDVVPATGAGRLVAPSPAALASGLIDVLRDPGARDAARQAGARWRERLSADHVAEQCLAWYRRALHA